MANNSKLNIEGSLIEYVNKTLFDINIDVPPCTADEIIDIFHEAKSQQVECLIYDEVLKSLSDKSEFQEVKESWRSFVMMRILRHKQSCRGLGKIFDVFNQSGIPYVTFKGYVFKELYPNSEMRYMGDIDIYVDKENVVSASDLLIKQGYYQNEDSDHPFHLTFKKDGHIEIELHYNFFHDEIFQNEYYLEKHIWDNMRTLKIDKISVSIPSLEHSLVQGVLHIATHFSGKGFGLRQLIDICLFLEKYKDEISMTEVKRILESYNSLKIYAYIVEMCNRFFYKEYNLLGVQIDETKLSYLNNLLFDSGVFGHKSYSNEIKRVVTQEKIKKNMRTKSSFRLKLIVLFPSAERIGERYGYAKKHKFLLPMAWMHRLIYGIVHPNEASKELLHHKIDVESIEKKIELLEFFGLNMQ